MNFALSDEQVMLRDAARDALSRFDGVAAARAAGDGAAPHDVWPIAREAGWTGLLVPEEHGGAGLGAFDAMLVAEECGRTLSGTGVYGHLLATHVLAAADDPLLPALASGELRAALAPARPPAADEGWTVARRGDGRRRAPAPEFADGRLTGEVADVPDLPGADVLVVVAAGPCAVLVEPGAEGLTLSSAVHFDGTRPLGTATFAGTPGRRIAVDEDALASAWYLAQALLAADALGGCQALLDMGVAYAKDRHAFGRPIGSYQAVKHQLVDILRHVDVIRNLTFYAGFAAQERPEEWPLAASCARFAGERGYDYATRTCIAVHGGIGATWEHDAPHYWRRAQLSRLLFGGAADAGDRVAGEIITKAQDQALQRGAA